MNVKFLKAGSGDCILIQDGQYNILIDGGNDFTYLQGQLESIYAIGQHIDLLVVTHHDDDHISGVIELMKGVVAGNFGDDFISKALINTPRKLRGLIGEMIYDQSLSYRQAYDLEQLLLAAKCPWDVVSVDTPEVAFGDIKLRFLSPTNEDLYKYSSSKGAYLTSDYRCDWDTAMDILDPFISDESRDLSDSNRTSVVILLEGNGKRLLLTGDCVPDRLEAILAKLILEGEGKRIKLDYFKLPHHGSYRSITQSLMSKVDCSKFVVTTNSEKCF